MDLLLLSNSTNYNEPYLEWCSKAISEYLIGRKNIVFIPYAGVSITYNEYEEKVKEGLSANGCIVKSIHHSTNPKETILMADAIMIGGGNTFALLKKLYDEDLLESIREKVKNGAKYVGWSAGSNVAGLGINTTNDMPIVYPPSFKALALVPFMINPHFTDKTIPNHGGETRTQRLNEFMILNKEAIITMEESSGVCFSKETYSVVGSTKVVVLKKNQVAVHLVLNETYNFSQ